MHGQVGCDEPGLVHLVETAYTEQLHCEIVVLELQSCPLKSLKLVSVDVRKGLSNASCPFMQKEVTTLVCATKDVGILQMYLVTVSHRSTQ